MNSILVITPMDAEYQKVKQALQQILKASELKHLDFLCTGIGKVNAASQYVSRDNVYDYVVLTGYAAGTKGMMIGDMVVASKVVQKDIFVPENIVQFMPEVLKEYALCQPKNHATNVVCCSTDSFIDAEKVKQLGLPTENAIYEMEGGAIAQAMECVRHQETASTFVIVKVISDSPSSTNAKDFEEFMAKENQFSEVAMCIKNLLYE